jgi:hypothetical protein
LFNLRLKLTMSREPGRLETRPTRRMFDNWVRTAVAADGTVGANMVPLELVQVRSRLILDLKPLLIDIRIWCEARDY